MFFGRPNTIKTQKCLFAKWVKPKIKNPLIFTERDLRELISEWEKLDLKPNTIKSLVSLTKKYIQWETGNPLKLHSQIRLNAVNQKEIQALDYTQISKLFSVLKRTQSQNIYTACMLAYHAGLRKGEVFGLQWNDIDFSRKCIIINKSYSGPTKSGKPRMVPLADKLKDYLLQLKIPHKNATLVRPFNPSPILKKACSSAGVPIITFHAFRHSFATLALNAGKPIREVQDFLGHSKASTTIDLYWQNTNKNMKVDFT